MNFKIDQYQAYDWEILKEWWEDHGWTPIPDSFLPNVGKIVRIEEVPVCAGFLYRTDSLICILEWVISDKKSDRIIREQALDLLIETLIEVAKKAGFKMIHTSIKHPRLIERMKKHGFSINDEGMTNMSLFFGEE